MDDYIDVRYIDPWIGLGVGFFLSLIILAIVVGVGTSKWWHRRRHNDGAGLRIFTCDHCYAIWEQSKSDNRSDTPSDHPVVD